MINIAKFPSTKLVAKILEWTNVKEASFFIYMPDNDEYALSKNPETSILTYMKPSDGNWDGIITDAYKQAEKIGQCLALSSNVVDQNGNDKHLLFFDMEGRYYSHGQYQDAFIHGWPEMETEGSCIVSSGKSYHVYTKMLLDFDKWLDALTAGCFPPHGTGLKVDKLWVMRSIYRRCGSIRLIKHAAKPGIPKVEWHDTKFPWMATYHKDFVPGTVDPDNDLPF